MKMVVTTKEEILKNPECLHDEDFTIRPFPCPHCQRTIVIGYEKVSMFWLVMLGIMIGGLGSFGATVFSENLYKFIFG